jgi:hypothetical protein
VELTYLPHGIDTSVFYPRDRNECRKMFGWLTVNRTFQIEDDEILVGIVATNQARKDFGQAIQVFMELRKRFKCGSGFTPTRWIGSGRFLTC